MSSARIGVAVIHGIGTQRADFADILVRLLQSSLERRGMDAGFFAFQPVHWAPVLSSAERALLDGMMESGPLDWPPLRLFVVETLADAVAYRRAYPKGWDSYHLIHWVVFEALDALRAKLASPTAPLVFLGHSLGSVIMSDHVWDEQKNQGFGRDAFTRCETLAGIVTFGSNIPLFTLALSEVRCIRFPATGGHLTEGIRSAARWRNFYDRDDVLGYPLRTLSDSYAATVEADVELSAGGAFTRWNPLSHNGYWTEKRFVESVADQLQELAKALDRPAPGLS